MSAGSNDQFRGWIGSTETVSDILTERIAAGFSAVLDRVDVASTDGAIAGAVHWCLCPAIRPMSALGVDGHPKVGGFLPPVPLERRMWAGSQVQFHDSLRRGDQVTRHSTVEGIEFKQGRGGALCFVRVHHRYETVRGLAIEEHQDIVYKDGTEVPPVERALVPFALGVVTRVADPVLLFRYSALTFNGHRIHYDLPYTRDEEGYDGLVVHGPLQATLLLEHAARLRDATLRRFAFRGVAPLIAGRRFAVESAEGDEGARLWILDDRGQRTMEATAQWE